MTSGVLPRVLRRPVRAFSRSGVAGLHVPSYAAPALIGAVFAMTGLYGMAIGGHYPQVVQTMTAHSGFAINDVRISGNNETSDIDILQKLGLNGWTSLVGLDADAARERVASLPWVESASVRKVYPDAIEVSLVEKKPFAIWQRHQDLTVIESSGEAIGPLRGDRLSALPLVVGEGAAKEAKSIVARLYLYPDIAAQVAGLVRVAGRRWDLQLRNGVTVKLPEVGEAGALDQLVDLERKHGLLERDILAVDMRLEDRVVVKLTPDGVKNREAAVKEIMKRRSQRERRA